VTSGWDISKGILFSLQFDPVTGQSNSSPYIIQALFSLEAPPRLTLRATLPSMSFAPFTGAHSTNKDRVAAQLEHLKILLAHGANPNLPDEDGRSALHHAATNNSPSQAFIILIDAGANLDSKSSMGSTARDFIRHMFSNNALPALEANELRAIIDYADRDAPHSEPPASPTKRANRI
jgi:ankyrin repeat protein